MAIAAAVMTGLRKLPREAVPGTLEIVMQATGVDSVTLLSGLLRFVPAEIELAQKFEVETAGTRTEIPNLITYVAALLYLLKASAHDNGVVDKVFWTSCIPLLRIQNPRLVSLQIEVIKMMDNTVVNLGLWRSMATILGRICDQTFIAAADEQEMAGSNWEVSQFISNSCQLIGVLLKSAIEATQETSSSTILDTDTVASAEEFCIEIVCKFIEPALALLTQPHQTSLRRLAVSTLLLPILESITRLEVTAANLIRPATPEISRSTTTQQIWVSCKILFKHGHLLRHDAYVALAAFAEYLLPPVQRIRPKEFGIDYFDIRNDPFFWEELKVGLAHDDRLIRERALYVLKQALLDYSGRQDDLNDSKFREGCLIGNLRLERWRAFVFLFEMLDAHEGLRLVEGTLIQKISFLLPFSKPKSGEKRAWANPGIRSIAEGVDVDFKWMSVLFQRGFNHEIVRVRQIVLRSFLELDWARAPKVKAFVPEEFVLGPFLTSLDDPVQHQEFNQGPSNISTLAAKFIRSYCASLSERNREGFIQRFAKVFCAKAPCCAGMMSFAVCLEAATVGLMVMEAESSNSSKANSSSSSTVALEDEIFLDLNSPSNSNNIGSDVLDSLELVVKKSKGHFDQNYRAKVYDHILVAAAAMNQVPFIVVNRLAKFITCFPRELLHQGGRLHDSLLKWIHPSPNGHNSVHGRVNSEEWLRRGLTIMMEEYLRWDKPNCAESQLCQDDLRIWEETARRWTRVVAIGVVSNETQQKLVLLVERCLTEVYQRAYMVPRVAEKTLLLFRCLLKECVIWQCAEYQAHVSPSSSAYYDEDDCSRGLRLTHYVADSLLNTLVVLAQNAKNSAGVFWEYHLSSEFRVPVSTEARSQDIERNQNPSATASAVMQGVSSANYFASNSVLAVTTLAESCIWYCRLRSAAEIPEGVINFFWDFAWKVVNTPAAKTEAGAKVQLGSYEALVTVCGAWAATVSPVLASKPMAQILEKDPFAALTAATVVENLLTALDSNVRDIMQRGLLTNTQCEALVLYKWSSMEYLLSIPKISIAGPKEASDSVNQLQSESSISISVLQDTLQEAIHSLESAGEELLLPLLHSIRWLMQWDVFLPVYSTEEAQDKSVQIMWSLVQSGWATMAKCSQPRVWAAFLNAILHPTVFGDKEMHEDGIHEDDGPLKWLICRLITKGNSTPRAMRLTAIHMTGLWLQFPTTLTCYTDQLKILVLFGEEVADKVVDGEARKNQYEATEDTMLLRGYGIEISEANLSSEDYSLVTIAVMFHLIAQVIKTAENSQDNKTMEAAKFGAECGCKLLLDLLAYVVGNLDLPLEQQTNRSSVRDTPRQKLRAWQMLCILAQYVSRREIDQVTSLLKFAIESNELPSVRHYIEAFAVRVFLQFPCLVEKHLVPVLHDHSIRAQARSSYTSIAVNVVLCTSSADLRLDHLRQVLPAICPLMTTSHQRSDAFTQVLVYHILQRWINGLEQISPGSDQCLITDQSCIDRLCLQSLATYMEANADCMRLKPSVELYLDTFDPIFATTPEGVFCKQGEDYPIQMNNVTIDRVSVAALHQIFRFLNSARKVSTEPVFRKEFIIPERSSKVNLSRSMGKEVPGSVSISKHEELEQLQSVPSPETLADSEVSTKTSSGSIDSATWSSDAASTWQKLHPQVRSHFQRRGDNSDSSAYESKDNSSLEISGLQKDGQGDKLQLHQRQQELIVIATAQADRSAFAGFARTCEAFETARLVIANRSKSQEHHDNRFTSTRSLPYEVLDTSLKKYLNRKRKEGFTLLGLGKGAFSVPVGNYSFCNRSLLILGGEYGVPRDIIPMLDVLIEVANPDEQHPLDVFVGASIVLWEYTQQHPKQDVTLVLTDSDRPTGAQVHAKTSSLS